MSVLDYLQNMALADWVRSSPSIFAYTTVLTLHAVGLALVIGVNTLIGLRLLGVAPGIPLTELERLYGVVWVGFLINLSSGFLLFIAEANSMAAMVAFWAKLFLVACGMTIALQLKRRYFSDRVSVAAGIVTRTGRNLAIGSLFCWYLALIVGRLTGYPDLVAGWLHMGGGGG